MVLSKHHTMPYHRHVSARISAILRKTPTNMAQNNVRHRAEQLARDITYCQQINVLLIHIYIYMCLYTCVYIYIYTYVYIHTLS